MPLMQNEKKNMKIEIATGECEWTNDYVSNS